MVFGLLFVLSFIVGFGIYASTRNWRLATVVPSLIYVGSVVADRSEGANLMMSFIFGLPIVFVAALLGCFIFVQRFVDSPDELEADNLVDTDSDQGDDINSKQNQMRP